MKTLFLDVGGHHGQTVAEVIKAAYKFDTIHCFEPLHSNAKIISEKFLGTQHLNVHNFGLSNQDSVLEIFERHMGDMGASTKRSGVNGITTPCSFIKASQFFRENIAETDAVLMKLNCEGAECDILNDLIDSGEIWKITNVMIDFDVRKFHELEGEEARLMSKFKNIGFDRYSLQSDVMIGKTHQARIANWIRSINEYQIFREQMSFNEKLYGWIRRIKHKLRS